MDEITGFDEQINGFFDFMNPASKIKKAQEMQRKMIQQKMNQSNVKSMNTGNSIFSRASKNIQSRNAKKQLILKLINSL